MDLGIRGKKALVCAASRGLGKSIATALAEEGVELFLCAREVNRLTKTAEQIQEKTLRTVHTIACDLMTIQGRNALIEKMHDQMGDPDILIHNIGGPPPSYVDETTLDAWESGFQRLVMSVAHLNEAFIPGMRKQGWGRVVGVTSIVAPESVAKKAEPETSTKQKHER
jgi:3-oxoacyl-[acyl-carrier protein] reductase